MLKSETLSLGVVLILNTCRKRHSLLLRFSRMSHFLFFLLGEWPQAYTKPRTVPSFKTSNFLCFRLIHFHLA